MDEKKREKRPISNFFGTLEDVDSEWDEIEKEIYKDRLLGILNEFTDEIF